MKLKQNETCKIFHSCEIKMSHIVGRAAPNRCFEKTRLPLYWILPPLLKGSSFLNYFLADKSGHSTITFGEIMGTPINRVA